MGMHRSQSFNARAASKPRGRGREAIAEVVLCPASSSERVAVLDLLDVIQPCGYAFAAARVEGVEVNRYAAVAAGVNLFGVKDGLRVLVNDAGLLLAGAVEEVAVCVRLVVRAFRRVPLRRRSHL